MIELRQIIDTSEYPWCRDAALIRITGGRGVLTERYSEETDDYTLRSSLMLCGSPIMQAEYPECPTCSALLARGCGIENVDCDALRDIRDRINSPYTGINTAVLYISEILHLLKDGYYVIADACLYPTDGTNRFFMNVPDKLTDCHASCDSCYEPLFSTCVDSFPAYIYPTQSNTALDTDRAKHYLDMIDAPDAPRAIAYYDYGFMCALLDGHHKAYAAAMKGCTLPTIVIIPLTSIWGTDDDKTAHFSAISLPFSLLDGYEAVKTAPRYDVTFTEYHNPPVSEKGLILSAYPTMSELVQIYAAGEESTDVTPALALEWLHSKFPADRVRLLYTLTYIAKRDPARAYGIAAAIVKQIPPEEHALIVKAYRIIADTVCPEAEKLVTDYLIDHDHTAPAWDICLSYRFE